MKRIAVGKKVYFTGYRYTSSKGVEMRKANRVVAHVIGVDTCEPDNGVDTYTIRFRDGVEMNCTIYNLREASKVQP